MSELFNAETDYDPQELAELIDVDCDQPSCRGTCEVDILPRYGKVVVWCSKCDCDLGEVARRAHKIPYDAPLLVRPTFNLTGAALKHVNDYARALALAESPNHHVFVIGDTFSVVRPNGMVEELHPTALRIRLAEVAQSRTSRGWADPPPNLVSAIMEAATDQESIPKLERINTVPVIMADGRILDTPGYDAQSLTYYAPVVDGINVPKKITAAKVSAAVELLTVDYLGDVAFKGQPDRANTIACMLLPFVRTLIGPTPLHVFDAPSPGHGKTQTLASALMPGCGLVDPSGWAHSSAEQTKSLVSALRKAPNAMFFDNVTGVVQSEALEQILTSTSGYWSQRILGESRMATVPVHQTWTMSTNNGRMGRSMQRRSVWIRIDAAVEHPELRPGPKPGAVWRHPEGLVEWAERNRGDLVSACLVLCRWWIDNGMPAPTIAPTAVRGSYERWQYVIGGILQLAGIDGFCENSFERDMSNDEQSELSVMLTELRETFGDDGRFNAADSFDRGCVDARTAIGTGMILSKHVDEISGGLVLRKWPVYGAADQYSVQLVGSGDQLATDQLPT